METAEPIAIRHGLRPQAREELGEFRFGAWEGTAIDVLETDPEWRRFNTCRGSVRAPGGELMLEVQARMTAQLECLRKLHDGEMVVIVSHGDPLRSVVAHYLGIPLDLILRFEISPASVTVIERDECSTRVLCINETGDVPL